MPEDSRELLRLNEFFAFEKKVAALFTVLLRRFFSPPPALWSPVDRRKRDVEGGDSFFCDTAVSPVGLLAKTGVSGLAGKESTFSLVEGSEPGGAGIESAFSLGGLEEPLNILFSNPP